MIYFLFLLARLTVIFKGTTSKTKNIDSFIRSATRQKRIKGLLSAVCLYRSGFSNNAVESQYGLQTKGKIEIEKNRHLEDRRLCSKNSNKIK